MHTILLIIGIFALGYLARRLINEPHTLVKWLNNHIIYIAMPSIILLKVPPMSINSAMLVPAALPWLWAVVGGLLIILISRLLHFPKPLEGAVLLLALLGNTSFLGFPMVQAFFNDSVLSYAIVYDQIGNFLLLSTVGLLIIAAYAPKGSGHEVTFANIAKRVFSFPPFIALLAASLLPVDAMVNTAEPLLSMLGNTLMPAALFVIGLQFQPQLLPEHRKPLITAISLKMLLAPALAYLIVSNLPIAIAAKQATIFETAMPCMITPGIMAIQAGLAPRFCATLLGYSTLFSFLWLPIVAAMLIA